MNRSIVISAILVVGTFLAACKKENTNPDEIGTVRYDSFVFNEVDVALNVSYGNATTQGGQNQNLLMDIYTPKGDNASNRPLIVLAHGGGFQVGDKESMSDLSMFLAKSGYVVASINYRLIDIPPSPDLMKRAVIDAMQDMRAAIRFFRKDNVQQNTYRINPSKIYAGGYSAGAFMGLHSAYVNTDAEILTIGGQSLLDYVNNSGGHEGNSGNPGFASNFNGAISLAGALFKADFIDAGEPILYSFHGTGDQVVPYNSGDADGSGVITEGPALYHPVADAVGVLNKLYSVPNGSHDIFWETQGAYSDLRSFIYADVK